MSRFCKLNFFEDMKSNFFIVIVMVAVFTAGVFVSCDTKNNIPECNDEENAATFSEIKFVELKDFDIEGLACRLDRLDSIEQKMLKDEMLITEDEMFGTVYISVYNHEMSRSSFKKMKEHDGKITKILREIREGSEKTIFMYTYEN